jgi:hypothetical protein
VNDDIKDAAKIAQVLAYCRPHLEYMWASSIVAILLGCDFRDAKNELEKFLNGEVK